jgi:hypothetical protein
VYQVVVPKSLAPKELVKVFEGTERIVLPPWDPMVCVNRSTSRNAATNLIHRVRLHERLRSFRHGVFITSKHRWQQWKEAPSYFTSVREEGRERKDIYKGCTCTVWQDVRVMVCNTPICTILRRRMKGTTGSEEMSRE